MLARERIISFIVIQNIQSDHLEEGFLRVALFTILSEFILMNIFVAINAVGKGDSGEFLKFPAVLLR